MSISCRPRIVAEYEVESSLSAAFTSIIDSQLLPMRVGIVFLMGCCILAAYCTNKRKNIEKKEYPMLLKGYPEHCKGRL